MRVGEKLGGLEAQYRALIEAIGEDPDREGLLKTPQRAAEAFRYFTRGYRQDVATVLNKAIFEEDYDDMVIVKDIEFYSLCEHHLVPFFGRCHVGYLPAGKIVGLSKIARLVEMFSRRLQVQERLTHEIAHALEEAIQPRGVAVVMQARHLCMMMRGVEKQGSQMVTSAVLGAFRERDRTREEFMSLLRTDARG
jgi:GTP cyclohydrolase IA